MGLSRRRFLGLSLGLGLLSVAGFLTRRFFASSPPAELGTLKAYLDTLIPADEEMPGAVELGIAERMFFGSSRRYRRLLRKGCDWLDKEAGKYGAKDFSVLSPARREEVVRRAAEGEKDSLPYLFFDLTRDEAFSLYYAEPRVWRALGYFGPPQPLGFMDYTQAPKRQGFH